MVYGTQHVQQLQHNWRCLMRWYNDQHVHHWHFDGKSTKVFKISWVLAIRRFHRCQSQNECELLMNNQLGVHTIQGGSNRNEKLHADQKRYMVNSTFLGAFLFDTCTDFIELRQDINSLNYINKNKGKFPSRPDLWKWTEIIQRKIDDIVSLRGDYMNNNNATHKMLRIFVISDKTKHESQTTDLRNIKRDKWSGQDTVTIDKFIFFYLDNDLKDINCDKIKIDDSLITNIYNWFHGRFDKIQLMTKLKSRISNSQNIMLFIILSFFIFIFIFIFVYRLYTVCIPFVYIVFDFLIFSTFKNVYKNI